MNKNIIDKLTHAFKEYAKETISDRAIPHIFDGLKPVQKRALLVLYNYVGKFKKSAAMVGETLGKYHPHGDNSIYLTLVRLAQTFVHSIPFIQGQGNFGSIDGDDPAAMRYTEMRLSNLGQEFFKFYKKELIQTRKNYDGSLDEPIYLPSPLPNLLLTGSIGIAVGLSTSIPPHNLGELMDGLIYLINNPQATLEDILNFIKGPDFATGGIIANSQNLYDIYSKGEGIIYIKGSYIIDGDYIIFNEIPYGLIKSELVQAIAEKIADNTIEGVYLNSLKDESNKNGIRIVLKIKPDANPHVVINQIYENTSMQCSFRIHLLAVNEKLQPITYTLMGYLHIFLEYRDNLLQNQLKLEIDILNKKIHNEQGLIIFYDNYKSILDIIQNNSKDVIEAELEQKYSLSSIQIKNILDSKIYNLSKSEQIKIRENLTLHLEEKNNKTNILQDKEQRKQILIDEFNYFKNTYKTPRRTVLNTGSRYLSAHELINSKNILISIDCNNYIKYIQEEDFVLQKKGGKGKNGKEIKLVAYGNTHEKFLFFTDQNRVFSLYGYELPKASFQDKGYPIINYLNLEKNENIICIIEFNPQNYLLFITKDGYVRKTAVSQFDNIRNNGKKYTQDYDVFNVINVTQDELLFLGSKNGMACVCEVNEFREIQSRNSKGVKGMKLKENDTLVSAFTLKKDTEDYILTVTSRGLGKISKISDYRITKRNASGVKNYKSKKNESIINCLLVKLNDQIIIYTDKGSINYISLSDIRITKRTSQGVQLRHQDNQRIIAVEKIG